MVDTVKDLILRLNRHMDYASAWGRRLDAYYHARQPLAMLPAQIREDCGDRLPTMRVNFARLVVDAIEERLDIEGFRLADNAVDSDALWMIWQSNGMDEWSQLAHLEAMIHGRSFATVWADADGFPRITVESARQMTVWSMPGNAHRIAALKRWVEPDGHAYATLFQPHLITKWRSPAKIAIDPTLTEAQLYMSHSHYDPYAWWDWSAIPATGWELRAEPIPNPLGVVPVVPLNNRPRLLNWGESELLDVLPLVDAINKLATDMLVSAEYHATPRRYATGIEVQTRINPDTGAEEVIDPFTKLKGRNWLAEDPETRFGQFDEARLDGFTNAIASLTQQIGAITGLPPHYLGIAREPGSADAIRSSEAPLVTKARRKQRAFGGSWEEVLRLAVVILDGYVRPGLASMETVWRNAETRTVAQEADAATKLAQIGFPPEQLAEDLGYSPQAIDAMDLETTPAGGVSSAPSGAPTGNGARLLDAPETQREIRGDAERAR